MTKNQDRTTGFASAFDVVGLPVIAAIISVFAVLSILTVVLTFLLGVIRVRFSLSRDRLLRRLVLQDRPPRNPTQRVTWISGISSAFLAGGFPIKTVAGLTNIGILAAYVVVCLSVIIFRYERPDAHERLRLPCMPVVPALGVLDSGFLDAAAALEDVAAVRHLAGGRPDHLLLLRSQALAHKPGQSAARRTRGA